jgi:hypothetical protein
MGLQKIEKNVDPGHKIQVKRHTTTSKHKTGLKNNVFELLKKRMTMSQIIDK